MRASYPRKFTFLCFEGPVNIPPLILANFNNQGGDDDGDEREHEDEQDLRIQWCLATYSDGSPLLVCIQGNADVTEEPGIVSHGRTLQTYSIAGYLGWILPC